MSPRRTTRSTAKGKAASTRAAATASRAKTQKKSGEDRDIAPAKVNARPQPRPYKSTAVVAEELFDDDVEVLDFPIHVKGSPSRRGHAVQSPPAEDDDHSGDALNAVKDASEALFDFVEHLKADRSEEEDLDEYGGSFIDDTEIKDRDSGNERGANDFMDVVAAEQPSDADSLMEELQATPPRSSPSKRPINAVTKTASPAKKQRREQPPIYDSDSEAVDLPLAYYEKVPGNHPFNLVSELGKMWFGPTAYLMATHQYENAQTWREKQYFTNRATINHNPYRTLQFTDFNYLADKSLLGKYSEWLDLELGQRYHDSVWMAEHVIPAVDLVNKAFAAGEEVANASDYDADDADVVSVAAAGDEEYGFSDDEVDISASKGKETRKGKERQLASSSSYRTPKKPAGNSAKAGASGNRAAVIPRTPTSVLTARFKDLTLPLSEAKAWALKVVNGDEQVPMPGIDMSDIEERFPEILPGGVPLHVLNIVNDLLRGAVYSHLSRRAQAKLAVLACTPTFGRWIYNWALVPESMLCSYPSANTTPKPTQMEIRRHSSQAGASNGKVAGVLFGTVAVQSNLLHPHSVQMLEQRLSKSVNVLPLDAQFNRTYSMFFKLFDVSSLKLSVYQHGLTFRTRMVTGTTAGAMGTEVGNAAPQSVDPNAMPRYLNKLQHTANDSIPIYDASEYFVGKKQHHSFAFGDQDILCPRLQRELMPTDYVAVIHSVNTYSSGKWGGTGLSFNVYYVVLLVPGSGN